MRNLLVLAALGSALSFNAAAQEKKDVPKKAQSECLKKLIFGPRSSD